MPEKGRRDQVLRHRFRIQQLDRASGTPEDTAVLDLGVQETGPDGALWALAVRGVDVAALVDAPDDDPGPLTWLWTLRGAPHAYRRADLASVLAAVRPFSDADAAKRMINAAAPLKAAGIGALEGLDAVADVLRDVVRTPTVKGEASAAATGRLPDAYLRDCVPCGATHPFELSFRLGATTAGLELVPGTSPPVLRPATTVEGKPARPADTWQERHDIVRGAVRLLGPTTPALVAGFLEIPAREVKAHWPEDVVPVVVEGTECWLLEGDLDAWRGAAAPPDRPAVRLVGPYDLCLQARDRELIVPDADRRPQVWRTLGRPGAVLVDGEVRGTWRPRTASSALTVRVEFWTEPDAALRDGVADQAEALRAFRGARKVSVEPV